MTQQHTAHALAVHCGVTGQRSGVPSSSSPTSVLHIRTIASVTVTIIITILITILVTITAAAVAAVIIVAVHKAPLPSSSGR